MDIVSRDDDVYFLFLLENGYGGAPPSMAFDVCCRHDGVGVFPRI